MIGWISFNMEEGRHPVSNQGGGGGGGGSGRGVP